MSYVYVKTFESFSNNDIDDILNQIDKFINSKGRNLWVHNDSISIYIRNSKRIYQKEIKEFFDFASIEVHDNGNGFFTELINKFEEKYPTTNIFIESVLTDRFCQYIEKSLGFHKINDQNNFYKIKS